MAARLRDVRFTLDIGHRRPSDQCPLWARKRHHSITSVACARTVFGMVSPISGSGDFPPPCPVYPRKQTSGGGVGMSAESQFPTHALAQSIVIRGLRRRARAAEAGR